MAGYDWRTPAGFLMWGGVILLVLGIVGFVVPRLPPGGSVGIYFTPPENYAHVVLGIVAIAASMYTTKEIQKWLTTLVGLAGLFFGITGLLVLGGGEPNYYGLTNLELIDDAIHLVVGVWALWTVYGRKK
jgi:hypothetical protein